MAYDGFLSLGGVELINEERTRTYVEHQLPGFPLVRNPRATNQLHVALEDDPYESPLIDDADWVNPADPATHGFFGLYPLEIQGIGSSTRVAPVTQSIGDGGTVGRSRDGSREIRVHGVLLGANELAVEAGLAWLRSAMRTANCSLHGGTCGESDLRYFLDTPAVCSPLFQQVEGRPVNGETYVAGNVTVDAPLIVNIDQVIEAPAYVTWQFELVDGVVITYGKMSRSSSDRLKEYGPIILQRTNFLTNPSFGDGATGWKLDAGNMTPVTTGGADGGAYLSVDGNNNAVVRINWVPDPGFTGDPAVAGWRTDGAPAYSQDDATAPNGRAGVFEANLGQDELNLEVSLLGPSTPQEMLFSVAVKVDELGLTESPYGDSAYGQEPYNGSQLAPDGGVYTAEPGYGTLGYGDGVFDAPDALLSIWVTVNDNLGRLVHTESVPIVPGWSTLTVRTTMGFGYVVRLTLHPAVTVHLATALAEPSNPAAPDTPGTFFSGDTPDDPGTETVYTWLGPAPASASQQTIGSFTQTILTADAPDTRYGDLVSSFALRSWVSAVVVARLVSLDDGTILAERTVQPGFDWTRYALFTPYGRNVQLQLVGMGDYDVDQALIEAAGEEWDYLDGDTPPLPGYTTRWLGRPNASYSQTSWTGSTLITANDSDWRPFIATTHGTLRNVTIDMGYYDEISVDDQLEPLERNYHGVSPVQGPTVLQRYQLDVGAAIEVDFLLEASPFAYSNSQTISLEGLSSATFNDPAPDPTVVDVLVDPDCAPIPAAPRPPTVPDPCVQALTTWRRYFLDIPAENVALWGATVPTITLSTKTEVRQLRVRFHPNPFGYQKEVVDPLSYCGEFILSYLPTDTALTVNGMSQRAFASVAGRDPVPADQLLYGTDGAPMEWPSMSCAIPYVMTIDVSPTGDLSDLDVAVVVNRRE